MVVGDHDQLGYWMMVDCISIKENFPSWPPFSSDYFRLLARLAMKTTWPIQHF
jgi:hypothetical protein